MGYSRWGERGNGHWYSFWAIHPPDKEETRDNATFEIYNVAIFSARELRENIDKCIAIVVLSESDTTTKKEFEELRGYMIDFLYDVDEEYPSFIPFF